MAARIPFAVPADSVAQREVLKKSDLSEVQALQHRVNEILQAREIRLADFRHVAQWAGDLQKQLHLADHEIERLSRVGWPRKELSHCQQVLRMVDAWDELLAEVHLRMKTPNSIGGPTLLRQLAEAWTAIANLGKKYREIQDRARSAAALISALADRLASDARLEAMQGLRRGLASVLSDPAVRDSLAKLGAELPPLESSSSSAAHAVNARQVQGGSESLCPDVAVSVLLCGAGYTRNKDDGISCKSKQDSE